MMVEAHPLGRPSRGFVTRPRILGAAVLLLLLAEGVLVQR